MKELFNFVRIFETVIIAGDVVEKVGRIVVDVFNERSFWVDLFSDFFEETVISLYFITGVESEGGLTFR